MKKVWLSQLAEEVSKDVLSTMQGTDQKTIFKNAQGFWWADETGDLHGPYYKDYDARAAQMKYADEL